jgi:ABC-type multidrug transport system fused ATPase/permease subunit
MKNLINSVVDYLSGATATAAFRSVLVFVTLLFAVEMFGIVGHQCSRYISGWLSRNVVLQMRKDIMRKCISLDFSFFESHESQNKLFRTQATSIAVAPSMMGTLIGLLEKGVTIVVAVLALVRFNPLLCVAAFCVGLPNYWLNSRISRRRYRVIKDRAERMRRGSYLSELLTNRQFVRDSLLFSLGDYFFGRWKDLELASLKEDLDLDARQARFYFCVGLLNKLASAAAYVAIVLLAARQNGTVGMVTMYVGLFANAQGQVLGLSSDIAQLYENSVFLADYFELMAVHSSIENGQGGVPLEEPVRCVEFRNVSFAYPGTQRRVLEGISCNIVAGEHIFLAGRNGEGKTTLIKLMLRLYDPTDGVILVNGRDIREYSTKSLRRAFAVLMQDYTRYLFSIRENVIVGDVARRADEVRLRQSSKTAGLYGLVSKLPEGFDTMLGRVFGGDTDLSMGEWQSLALARIFFREASVHILDEPTANLDAKSEANILNCFKEQVQDKIAVIVSHRLSAASFANRVMFMEGGRIVEDGNHEELLERNGPYAALFRLQQANRVGEWEESITPRDL